MERCTAIARATDAGDLQRASQERSTPMARPTPATRGPPPTPAPTTRGPTPTHPTPTHPPRRRSWTSTRRATYRHRRHRMRCSDGRSGRLSPRPWAHASSTATRAVRQETSGQGRRRTAWRGAELPSQAAPAGPRGGASKEVHGTKWGPCGATRTPTSERRGPDLRSASTASVRATRKSGRGRRHRRRHRTRLGRRPSRRAAARRRALRPRAASPPPAGRDLKVEAGS